MVALTRFTVTIFGPPAWCDTALADTLADLAATALGEAAQAVANMAPLTRADVRRLPVRIVVTEDLGEPHVRCTVVSPPLLDEAKVLQT